MSTDLVRHTLSGATMGTRWAVQVYASSAADMAALEVALVRAVDRVDRQMSTWKQDSDLMRLNYAAQGAWVPLPFELMQVLERGLQVGRASGGAFDIGLGHLVNAWGFGAACSAPDEIAIRVALRERTRPTHAVLELDVPGSRARKHAPFALDLSGIAKGFAVDEMVHAIERCGLSSALVALDGELKALGVKADGTPWRVAVEQPDYQLRSPFGVIELRDASVATSGDYRHWINLGGRRLSHTIDRSRGGPIDNGIASVSVVAANCVDADAWATALMVLGPVKGKPLAEQQGLEALFIQRRGETLVGIPAGRLFDMRQAAPRGERNTSRVSGAMQIEAPIPVGAGARLSISTPVRARRR